MNACVWYLPALSFETATNDEEGAISIDFKHPKDAFFQCYLHEDPIEATDNEVFFQIKDGETCSQYIKNFMMRRGVCQNHLNQTPSQTCSWYLRKYDDIELDESTLEWNIQPGSEEKCYWYLDEDDIELHYNYMFIDWKGTHLSSWVIDGEACVVEEVYVYIDRNAQGSCTWYLREPAASNECSITDDVIEWNIQPQSDDSSIWDLNEEPLVASIDEVNFIRKANESSSLYTEDKQDICAKELIYIFRDSIGACTWYLPETTIERVDFDGVIDWNIQPDANDVCIWYMNEDTIEESSNQICIIRIASEASLGVIDDKFGRDGMDQLFINRIASGTCLWYLSELDDKKT